MKNVSSGKTRGSRPHHRRKKKKKSYVKFLKEQQERKKLKKQVQVQENIEITFMSAWFVMGVFLVSLIIYSMQS